MQTQPPSQEVPLGPKPVFMECPFCHVPNMTIVRYGPTLKTHLVATLLLLLGCWPCIFVPFCIPQLNNIVHYCPLCKAAIGTYEWPKKPKTKLKDKPPTANITIRPVPVPPTPPPPPKRKLS